MAPKPLNSRNKRVFNSVFGGPDISQPTPVATPVGAFTTPGEAFGGPNAFAHDRRQAPLSAVRTSRLSGIQVSESDNVRQQVQWDRSWHTATHSLVLPDVPDIGPLETWEPKLKAPDVGLSEALRDVLDPQTRLPFANHTEDLIVWHTNQVRRHFLRQVLPILLAFRDDDGPESLLFKVVKVLDAAHGPYVAGLSIILREMEASKTGASLGISQKFRRDLHAVISNSVTDEIADAVKAVLKRHVFAILGLPSGQESEDFALLDENYVTEKARSGLLKIVESLQNMGLAGEKFQVTFAETMNDAMTEYVTLCCKGIWSAEDLQAHKRHSGQESANRPGSILPRTAHHAAPSQCVTNLCEWIENRYAKLAVQVFHTLGGSQSNPVDISWTQVEKWKEMGIGHLGSLRTNELFDIVVNWPHSSAALDDLRTAITTPQRRLHLTDVFSRTLTERLLHPGASTLQILQTYISMISSFHALDHSKVLLDRVAYPLQLYLCSREDTVRIIITGLLSETEDAQGNPIGPGGDKLVELALLLNKGEGKLGPKAADEELDWHDPDWLPDPVDAGPGYKRSKSADVIGTLIRVLGAQDVFIKEFQNIIGEHLLKNDGGFEKEIKVLDLLKIRFGEAPLQSCEVMLKDIQDSGRVNSIIRRIKMLDPSDDEINMAHANFDMHDGGDVVPEGTLKPSLHAKILSRLFWPQLHEESYRVPDEVGRLQKLYETGFESLKNARKLTWLHALGHATVELELADRTIMEEVHTWQATVIWAFQSDEAGDTSVRRSVDELVQELEMDEALVRSALKFWTNKLVLQEAQKDVFTVLETLNQEDRARSNAQAAASAAAPADDGLDEAALMAAEGITADKEQMYWQFIQGMLKNSSSQMPLQQIAMMLKMLIADGFPYSNEELQVFLGTKVAADELEFAGGKYRLKK